MLGKHDLTIVQTQMGSSYRRKYGVSSPWAEHEAICQRQCQPVRREEVCSSRFPQGARGIRLDEAISNDNAHDWVRNYESVLIEHCRYKKIEVGSLQKVEKMPMMLV